VNERKKNISKREWSQC